MKESEYWDSVCDGLLTNEEGKFVVRANWPKVTKICRWVMGHDFRDKTVLELGPGVGLVFNILKCSGNVSVYYGLDPSDRFVEVAGKMFGLKVRKGKANQIPFKNETFDAVFAFDVLEHINPVELQDSYAEISRVAKPSARMFINNPLTEGKHDKRFDFKIDVYNIQSFCDVSGFRIYYLQEYSVIGKESGEPYHYQMIELRR